METKYEIELNEKDGLWYVYRGLSTFAIASFFSKQQAQEWIGKK